MAAKRYQRRLTWRTLIVAQIACFVLLSGCGHDREDRVEDAGATRVAKMRERRARAWPTILKDAGAEGARAKAARVFGIEDTASRRLFMFDGSGSMIPLMGDLRTRVVKEVDGLDAQTAFSILIFNEDDPVAMSGHWVMANAAGKKLAKDFVDDFRPHGATDPIPGIRQGFALKPEVIFLGTDGDFPNNREVLKVIGELNRDRKVKVNTVLYGDDPGPEIEGILRQIASESGGRFVNLKVLGSR